MSPDNAFFKQSFRRADVNSVAPLLRRRVRHHHSHLRDVGHLAALVSPTNLNFLASPLLENVLLASSSQTHVMIMSTGDLPVQSARILQACDHCRSLKIRCLPSSTLGFCQKCLQSARSSCKHSEVRPRPTRYRKVTLNSEARIAELERKVNEAVAAKSVGSSSTEVVWTSNSTPSASSGPSICADVDPVERLSGHLRTDEGGNAVPDVLRVCGFTLEAAEQYMARFRSMSEYFPFVVLPPHKPILTLARDAPFLCLSAICVASAPVAIVEDHKQLESIFRKTLLHKITIDGHRTLELLQALLVYLGWYQFFSTPKRDQSYMLIQTAISVCIDLGLDLSPAEAMHRSVGLRLDHYRKYEERGREVRHDEFFSRRARRAYLGCHYLSAQMSSVFGKPTRIHPTKYMYNCARSLADEPEYGTDVLILPLTKLQRLSDDYHKYLLPAQTDPQDESSLVVIRTHLEALQEKVTALQNGTPEHRRSPQLALEIAIQFSQMQAHEMGLINPMLSSDNPDPIPSSSTTTSSSSFSTTSSSIRLEILLLCLRSTLRLIRTFLALPPSSYTLLSTIQWTPIIVSTVYLYKLSVGLSSVPEWDVRFATNALDLSQYLSTVSGRLLLLPPANPAAPNPHPHLSDAEQPTTTLFAVLPHIFDDVRRTWEKLKLLPVEERMRDSERVHATEFPNPHSAAAAGAVAGSRCPAESFWANQNHGLDQDLLDTGDHVHAQRPEDTLLFGDAEHGLQNPHIHDGITTAAGGGGSGLDLIVDESQSESPWSDFFYTNASASAFDMQWMSPSTGI